MFISLSFLLHNKWLALYASEKREEKEGKKHKEEIEDSNHGRTAPHPRTSLLTVSKNIRIFRNENVLQTKAIVIIT